MRAHHGRAVRYVNINRRRIIYAAIGIAEQIFVAAVKIDVKHRSPVFQEGYREKRHHGVGQIAKMEWIVQSKHLYACHGVDKEDDAHKHRDVNNRVHSRDERENDDLQLLDHAYEAQDSKEPKKSHNDRRLLIRTGYEPNQHHECVKQVPPLLLARVKRKTSVEVGEKLYDEFSRKGGYEKRLSCLVPFFALLVVFKTETRSNSHGDDHHHDTPLEHCVRDHSFQPELRAFPLWQIWQRPDNPFRSHAGE